MFKQNQFTVVIPALLILLLSTASCSKTPPTPVPQPKKISFAIDAASLASAPVFIAESKGFWKEGGLDVDIKPFASGRLALDALLGSSVEAATSADIPVVFAAFRDPRVRILATFTTSEKHVNLLARSDRGIRNLSDLKKRKIGISTGTAGEYVMDKMLEANGLKRSDVSIVTLGPPDLATAFVRGDVDAIFTWQPHIYNARKQLGDKARLWTSEGVYDHPFNVVAMADSLTGKHDELSRLIVGLERASVFMQNNRQESIQIVAAKLGISSSELGDLWDDYVYKVGLKSDFAQALAREGAWAKQAGIAGPDAKEPDYKSILNDSLLLESQRGATR